MKEKQKKQKKRKRSEREYWVLNKEMKYKLVVHDHLDSVCELQYDDLYYWR